MGDLKYLKVHNVPSLQENGLKNSEIACNLAHTKINLKIRIKVKILVSMNKYLMQG